MRSEGENRPRTISTLKIIAEGGVARNYAKKRLSLVKGKGPIHLDPPKKGRNSARTIGPALEPIEVDLKKHLSILK